MPQRSVVSTPAALELLRAGGLAHHGEEKIKVCHLLLRRGLRVCVGRVAASRAFCLLDAAARKKPLVKVPQWRAIHAHTRGGLPY